MSPTEILKYRLVAHHLSGSDFDSAREVVAYMSAVQSQDFAAGKWALSQCGHGMTDADIQQAYDRGEILRTHVMRPTWHFVALKDIRWMLKLTAPRVNLANSYYNRQFALDDNFFAKSNIIIANAVRDGQYKTRKELGDLLEAHSMGGSSQRLALIVMRAEVDAIICSGPMRGKQFTYALLDERVAQTVPITTEEALSRLAERYFRSHGPATLKDFVWWSGLSLTDATAGLQLAKPNLQKENVADNMYWFDPSVMRAPTSHVAEGISLLQNYDEYVVSYIDRSFLVKEKHLLQLGDRTNPLFYNCIIYKGGVIGTWKRTIRSKEVVVSWKLFDPTEEQHDALDEAFRRYGTFLNLPVKYDSNDYTTNDSL